MTRWYLTETFDLSCITFKMRKINKIINFWFVGKIYFRETYNI